MVYKKIEHYFFKDNLFKVKIAYELPDICVTSVFF